MNPLGGGCISNYTITGAISTAIVDNVPSPHRFNDYEVIQAM